MKRIFAHRPTPATVIACIALFVALGGVSYGVATNSIDTREIADNTVRSKDIRNNGVYGKDLRNNEVRAIDIRNNTIRGRDIANNTLTDDQVDESKLQQVPSAADAARLAGRLPADFASTPEPVRLIGAGGQPPFENGAAASGAADLAPGFWKDGSGVVQLQGAVAVPASMNPVVLFILPEGYRPAGRVRYVVPAAPGVPGTVEIDSDGTVEVLAGGETNHLDGITFRVPATP
ncbi:MAG TPA: hypothetical protein VEX36_02750 [Thermoleophilaceae bacterium]|nr:hypothetical protein [Thermoleophilaceae bacterium]